MQIEHDNANTLQNLLDRARSVLHADSVVVVVHGDQTALPPVIASGEPRHQVLAGSVYLPLGDT